MQFTSLPALDRRHQQALRADLVVLVSDQDPACILLAQHFQPLRPGLAGVAPIILGHVANHRTITRAGVTLAVYSQYAYGEEKRAALDLWSDHLRGIVGGGGAVVLPLKRSKRGV